MEGYATEVVYVVCCCMLLKKNTSERLDQLSSHPQIFQEITVLTVAAAQKHDTDQKGRNKNMEKNTSDKHILAKKTI